MRKLVSYSKMNPELATALNIQFPNGIEQNVSTTKVGTQIVQTVMFEWDGIIYMVKIDTQNKEPELHEEDWPSTATKLINRSEDDDQWNDEALSVSDDEVEE